MKRTLQPYVIAALAIFINLPLSFAQSPLDRIEPYSNLVDKYVNLKPAELAFGADLGQVDSVLSVQTDLPRSSTATAPGSHRTPLSSNSLFPARAPLDSGRSTASHS